MDRPKFVVLALLLIITLLSGVRIYLSIEVGILQYQHAQTLKVLGDIKRKNTLLKEEILHNSSLTVIASKAAEHNFIPAQNYMYVENKYSP